MWEHVYSRVEKISVKSSMMLVRDSQDLLQEFKQVVTHGGNGSNIVVEPFIPSKTTKDEWYSLTRLSFSDSSLRCQTRFGFFKKYSTFGESNTYPQTYLKNPCDMVTQYSKLSVGAKWNELERWYVGCSSFVVATSPQPRYTRVQQYTYRWFLGNTRRRTKKSDSIGLREQLEEGYMRYIDEINTHIRCFKLDSC